MEQADKRQDRALQVSDRCQEEGKRTEFTLHAARDNPCKAASWPEIFYVKNQSDQDSSANSRNAALPGQLILLGV